MPARLPGDTRHQAIALLFEGRTVEEIVTALDGAASGSSIRNILSEVKRGVHQEFRPYREDLDEMRSLARRLRAGKLSLQEAATGLAVYQGVMQLGVDPKQLRDQIELFQRISPPDFPVDQFNKAALRMSKREAQTGMTFEQLETRDIEMRSRIASDENRQRELTNNINSLTAAEENARRTLQERLSHNKTTEEDLQRFLQERDTLHKAGLRPDDIRPVADLVEKCGTEEILTAAREMAVQVSKTGLRPEALVTEYNVVAELREKAVGELNEARAGTRESQVELQQLQQAKVDQLSRNRVTDAQLTSFLATKQQLAAWGISVDKLEPLKRVLAEIEKHGFQPNNIVAVLQTIVGLQERKQHLEAEIANMKTELGSGSKTLQGIKDEIVAKKPSLLVYKLPRTKWYQHSPSSNFRSSSRATGSSWSKCFYSSYTTPQLFRTSTLES